MPPSRKNNKKKKKSQKKSSRDRAEAAVSCAFCAHPVDESNRIQCICTRVVFCSPSCQQEASSSGTHVCPGALKATTNLKQNLRDVFSGNDTPARRQFDEEYRRTVTEPKNADLLSDRSFTRGMHDLTVDDYRRYADEGRNAAFAYLAGIHYKNRLLGKLRLENRGQKIVSDNTGNEQLGVLTTDELAFQYLSQAAQAGHGLAMQSLADCYEQGTGVRKSIRMCREWLWRASLQKSSGALPMLESKSIFPNEYFAHLHVLDTAISQRSPGQSMRIGGPNVATLVLALYQDGHTSNFTLPPFATTAPTLRVGSRPCQGNTGPITMVGAKELEELTSQLLAVRRQGYDPCFIYGRRGVGKEVTAQTYGEAVRSLDSNLFVVPPAPACDEVPTSDDVQKWIVKESQMTAYGEPKSLEIECIHSERSHIQWPACLECIADARERLSAVASGSIALSTQEALSSRGHTAIWRCQDGTLRSESFKDYGRGEVECALAALVASSRYPRFAHPLFVAQDPNIFWLLILYHGCIRAALEFVAPHVDWDSKLGPVKPPLPQVPIITVEDDSIKPGSILRKCGNDLCLKLESDQATGGFPLCGRCHRRSYCSQQCAKADWALHKRECSSAAAGSSPTAESPTPKDEKPSKSKRVDTGPTEGENVVIYGLVAKPEYNGIVGVISGDLSMGRYPVELCGREEIIAVKQTNFHRLGVSIIERANKAYKFACLAHGCNNVCSQCSLDFGIVNHLSNLAFSKEKLTSQGIERIAENHFATIKLDSDEMSCYTDRGFPLECHGLTDADKRFVLRALLESKEKSLQVAAAVAGMSCYGARSANVARPYTIPHLEALVNMIS